MRYSIDKIFECCYGHRVYTQVLNSKYSLSSLCKCRHLHGHQMTLKVGLGSDTLNLGMVTDFNHLNCIKKIVDDVLDHHFIMDQNDPLFYNLFPELRGNSKFLTDYKYYKMVNLQDFKRNTNYNNEIYEKLEGLVVVNFIPTSENLCKFFWNLCTDALEGLGVKVTYIDFWETPKSHCRYQEG